ncbi:16S rRNA (uracil(1498)-N(3))-methyltransferase [Buchnera aphidicola]|uniref:16S rRNA (uracil(1498)-N(3))-methyltransferase n=1 Tax=Buchnera aphidicola TaxID=9 RepID=UPI003464E1F0
MKKRIRRIYIEDHLKINQIILLSKNNTHYVKKVLRMKEKDKLEVFNNQKYVFISEIIEIKQKTIKVIILKKEIRNIESPLSIHLGLVISKNEKMKFSIQKSVELGVKKITPLISEYCHLKKKSNDFLNKSKNWKNIKISACQQCNRNIFPKINHPESIFSWCKKTYKYGTKIVFDPHSTLTMNVLPKKINYIRLLIGCEGGFSRLEIEKIIQYKFIPIKLGPRILRTETAVIAAITALQIKFGDFN